MKSKLARSVSVCPFDGLPCEYVDSCDDVMFLCLGFVPDFVCSRCVLKKGGVS